MAVHLIIAIGAFLAGTAACWLAFGPFTPAQPPLEGASAAPEPAEHDLALFPHSDWRNGDQHGACPRCDQIAEEERRRQ